ncbi:L-histidine N(alpha)-methyltransferase [Crocosphaera sp. UHCC 0190]|uniref:L-histidine N(alpha)-methyltransferase n=1 Tax=Crocosphaera sp. UHCC 0190 TaxID=3110246 RepID=UPI002B1EF3CD|nr:L-histidine N(alpha)-methyltransferase [Crocosphaera sp. UHCC 0190]MEA5510316.1 L-histidine N(alpha)-methyltransferase [Crocosphaera sp. UHCC 0190]
MLIQLSKGQLEITYLATLETLNNTENQEDQEVKNGLTKCPKTLPSKYFYDARGSELFEQICELPEYYPTRTEAWILQEYAKEIAQITGACELVELGSGSSTKTRLLLDAYQTQEELCKYVPIDVSESILKDSAIQLQKDYPSLQIQGLVGTYNQALTQLKATSLPGRMIFFLGSSIGNFSPSDCNHFLNKITEVLEIGDYFLLGIDLQKPQSILEDAYNDSQGVTAAFNLNMLSHLNQKYQGDFDLNLFAHQAIYNTEENQIEMYLISQQIQVVNLKNLDLTVKLEKNEMILTEISRKFNLNQVKKQLETKGLKTIKIFTDPQNWFGLILCQVIK